MTKTNKKVLKAEATRDGKPAKLAVVRPNYLQVQEGQKAHNKAFREALESGAILRNRVDHFLRQQNLWDDEKQARYEELNQKLSAGEKALKRGRGDEGRQLKLSEGRRVALDMRAARAELRSLVSERMALDGNTVEAQAENARFNYLVSCCTVYEDTGAPYFRSPGDYLARAAEDASYEAAATLASLLSDYDEDAEQKQPENAFLIKHRFADAKGRLVNRDGHLVDSQGRLIDEDGRYVRYDGGEKVFVDRDGNLVNDEGDYVYEDVVPFIDDVYDEAAAPPENAA